MERDIIFISFSLITIVIIEFVFFILKYRKFTIENNGEILFIKSKVQTILPITFSIITIIGLVLFIYFRDFVYILQVASSFLILIYLIKSSIISLGDKSMLYVTKIFKYENIEKIEYYGNIMNLTGTFKGKKIMFYASEKKIKIIESKIKSNQLR